MGVSDQSSGRGRERLRRALHERLPRGSRRLLLSAATTLAAAALASGAYAQLEGAPSPPTYDETEQAIHDTEVNGSRTPDTDYTPKYDGQDKDASKTWVQIEGARFADADDAAKAERTLGQATSYADNLYDVAFRTELNGLAVGERCQDPDPDALRSKTPEQIGCRPVVLHYTDTPEEGPLWRRVALPGGENPGYAAQVAWIDSDRAMVVGGTGVFPRREPPYKPDCQDPDDSLAPWNVKCDPAGMARAWLYDSRKPEPERWCELKVGDRGGECPALPADDPQTAWDDGMRGLTAVDFKPDPDWEIGFVAGLGQIWRFEAGAFDKRYDNHSPRGELQQSSSQTPRNIFRFRVRDLRVAPRAGIRAYAVTSGCCARYDTQDQGQVLTYTEALNSSSPIPGQWFLTSFEFAGEAEGPSQSAPSNADHPHQSNLARVDSFYAMTTAGADKFSAPPLALLASSASSDSALETRSQIRLECPSGHTGPNGSQATHVLRTVTPLSGPVRLLAIDGETPGEAGGCAKAGPDWASGELRTAAAPGRGRRGLMFSKETIERKRKPPYYDPPTARPQDVANGYQPTDEERVRQHLRARDQLVASYTVNGVDMVAEVADNNVSETGTGWAVGDHGAILKLSAGQATQELALAKAEPEPPRLTAGQGRALQPAGPYDPLRPPPAAPGEVPPLAARPLERLAEPAMVGMGSPDATHEPQTSSDTEDVAEIVMSRDGTEGWAIGTAPTLEEWGSVPQGYGVISLYHYDGSAWTRCDPKGIKGQIPPDPACAAVAPLRRYMSGNPPTPTTVKLVGAARVPYERDGNPDNDDDFEVVAIGTSYLYPGDKGELPVLLRYKDGRWGIDRGLADLMREIAVTPPYGHSLNLRDIAFTAPHDGWVLAAVSAGTGKGFAWLLLHWDGERWSLCVPRAAGCGAARVPEYTKDGALLGLAAAGDRVYVYGWRTLSDERPGTGVDSTADALLNTATNVARGGAFPLILYHERGKPGWSADDGGYDPYWKNPAPAEQGKVLSLSVAERPGGGYTGWAVGRFFAFAAPPDVAVGKSGGFPGQHNQGEAAVVEPTALLMRLEDARWSYFRDQDGALRDLMGPPLVLHAQGLRGQTEPQLQVTVPGAHGRSDRAFIAQRQNNTLFSFNAARGHFDTVASGRPPAATSGAHGIYQALAGDGDGGFWAVVNTAPNEGIAAGGAQLFFFHYTDHPHKPVFEETSHPLGDTSERFTGLAGSADGSVWAATEEGRLAHYDRALGWETFTIPGWDSGRVVTRRSEIFALAVNRDGVGVAVGKTGRIANLSPSGVVLDAAAGTRCAPLEPQPPCGTGFDLRAAAVAPDGSALAGGNALTVLHRPAGGQFVRVQRPSGNTGNRITAIAYPAPDVAWLSSDAGYVYAGTRTASGWQWRRENVNAKNELIGGGALRAIAVDAEGHGYAVGDRRLVLERTGDAGSPWRRLRGPGTDDLTAVTLGLDGRGALIGGRNGVVWTRLGDGFELARPADYSRGREEGGAASFAGHELGSTRGFVGDTTGKVVGMALLPGVSDGQAEAWVVSEARGRGTNRLFHYTSDPDEPLLSPDGRAKALPDTPTAQPGELAFAAFGNSDCDSRSFCPARRGTAMRHEVIGERIVAELRERAGQPGAPAFTLFTGDATFTAGLPAAGVWRSDRVSGPGQLNVATGTPSTDFYGLPDGRDAPISQRQWRRTIADRLDDGGLPLFGAVGPGDLSRPLYRCDETGCGAWAEEAKTGDNLTWRYAMDERPAPWGKQSEVRPSAAGLTFEAVTGSDNHGRDIGESHLDPDGDGALPAVDVKGGAHTHYAVDVKRGSEPVARVVVVDTSLRSLAASDAIQQPLEPKGQLEWLERMICIEGDTSVSGTCTRKPGQRVIVLTSTPTYSSSGASTETNTLDAIQLESLLLRHRASVVVSGRLNVNQRYWATAPGVHEPCPGAGYQDTAPGTEQRVCSRDETDALSAPAPKPSAPAGAVAGLAGSLQGLGAPPVPATPALNSATDAVAGILPFVVAASAGGPLGTNQPAESEQNVSDGYWNGYTVVRVPVDGTPTGVIVEQRPLFDWIAISGKSHVLRPGTRMTLKGVGREPIGYAAQVLTRFDAMDSPAITHRYDLLEADPEKPYIPKKDADGRYVALSPEVATVDSQTGRVRTGRGSQERTFAVALLSVGEKVASWPLVFEPGKSFRAKPAVNIPLPQPPRAPAPSPPQIRVLGQPPVPPPATPPPPAQLPNLAELNLPAPPALPPVPQALTLNPVSPPLPPAPPAPPVNPPAQPLALNALLGQVGVNAAPIPPNAPAVNPAPPSGSAARKEAKQRQAATAKSEEGSQTGAESAQTDLSDAPLGPHAADMTRRDRVRPAESFTPLIQREQPSAWARGALYGSGLTLMAFTLALGWSLGRPTPRRRPPEVPAPAFVPSRRR